MEIKTVGLDREAYEALRRQKQPGESFSDVVKRLARKRRPLSDFAGRLKAVPAREWRAFEAAVKGVREEGLRQADRPFKRWEKQDESR